MGRRTRPALLDLIFRSLRQTRTLKISEGLEISVRMTSPTRRGSKMTEGEGREVGEVVVVVVAGPTMKRRTGRGLVIKRDWDDWEQRRGWT